MEFFCICSKRSSFCNHAQDYFFNVTRLLKLTHDNSFNVSKVIQLIPSYLHHVLAESCGCITSTSAHVDQPSSHISYSSDIPLFRCLGNMLVILVVSPLLWFSNVYKLRDQYQAAICLFIGVFVQVLQYKTTIYAPMLAI